jgi:hypothetical protein
MQGKQAKEAVARVAMLRMSLGSLETSQISRFFIRGNAKHLAPSLFSSSGANEPEQFNYQ